MAGSAMDRRDRAGAMVGIGALLLVLLITTIGVSEDAGDRIVLPVFLVALAVAVGLSRRRLRLLAAAIGAGVPAGVALGAALRLAMLIAALMGGEVERSLGGTAFLVLFVAVPGTVLSTVLALLRRLVAVRAWVSSIGFAVAAAVALLVPAGTRVELAEEGVFVVNVVTFLASAALYGWLLVTLQERVEAWWDRRAARRRDPRVGAEVATA